MFISQMLHIGESVKKLTLTLRKGVTRQLTQVMEDLMHADSRTVNFKLLHFSVARQA